MYPQPHSTPTRYRRPAMILHLVTRQPHTSPAYRVSGCRDPNLYIPNQFSRELWIVTQSNLSKLIQMAHSIMEPKAEGSPHSNVEKASAATTPPPPPSHRPCQRNERKPVMLKFRSSKGFIVSVVTMAIFMVRYPPPHVFSCLFSFSV